MQKSKLFLVLHIIAISLLSVFSLTFGITLYALINQQSNITPSFSINLTSSLLIFGCVMFILGVGAIIASIKQWKIVLNLYEIVCLLAFVIFALVTIGVLGSRNNQQNEDQCYQPSNYFEHRMKQTYEKADQMYCSKQCPCQSADNSANYKKVQECPNYADIDNNIAIIFQHFELHLQCSGWCQINTKNYYLFNEGIIMPEEQNRRNCYDSWRNTLNQWEKAVIGCFSGQTILLFFVVVITNVRIVSLYDDEAE